MHETLTKVDALKLAGAKTLKDSLNLAVSYNLKRSIDTSDLENSDDININIDQTFVMISVSDKLLFNTASYCVKRATSIVRLLEQKYNVEGGRLIASGRGSTVPLVDNSSSENRRKNRRTRIVILPNLDKLFAMLSNEEVLE